MKTYKRVLTGLLSLTFVLGATSCGSSSSDSSSSTFSATENVKVADAASIEKIPDKSEKQIIYMGVADLNPTKSNPEVSTELALFQKKGGSIKYLQTTQQERYDKLATAITAGKNVPDIVNYEWLSFPSQVVKDMYQPIDKLADFTSPLWKGVKTTADQFVLGGKHYVLPLAYEPSAMLCCDKEVIQSEGLDDPYKLYTEGKWDWTKFESMMKQYVTNAKGDTERYGINGFFREHFIQQTGKTMVNYDSKTNQFTSNLDDADIEKGQNTLYDMMKEKLMLNGWIGSARECFKKNCLFYAMGIWGYSGANTPKKGESWEVVPIPQYPNNPKKITTSDMKAFMWVRSSTKTDAVKCWFECYRASHTDATYKETNKKKFMENNPLWTEDMYTAYQDVTSDDYLMLFDYANGVSSALGDLNAFDGNISLVDALYTYPSSENDEGVQQTWTQVKQKYSNTVKSEITDLNAKIKEFEAKNK